MAMQQRNAPSTSAWPRRGLPVAARLPAGIPLRAPAHPGQFLRRTVLEPLGLSQSEAARVLGVSRRRLHEIVQGQRGLSPDTAIRCALVFGTDAAFWLSLQSAWDNFHAWKALRLQGRRPAPLAPSRLADRFSGLR